MKIALMTDEPKDISSLVTRATWSGDKTQAARKLEFTVVQEDRDGNVPQINLANGNVIYGGAESGEVVFIGKIYELERSRSEGTIRVTCYDNAFVLNKSKTTRKYKDALPEDIAAEICSEMGISTGSIARTGENVSFIANDKTGIQIIMTAYDEAKKKNRKQYQVLMTENKLDVVESGTLIDDLVLDAAVNMMDSIYKESIEKLVNKVKVTDDSGNGTDSVDDTESQNRYGLTIQATYKQQADKDAATEAADLFKEPEREGTIKALGDYRAISGYSLIIKDGNFNGQFTIKSDVHTFHKGVHEMKLNLEFIVN